jgi:hypothetical protein
MLLHLFRVRFPAHLFPGNLELSVNSSLMISPCVVWTRCYKLDRIWYAEPRVEGDRPIVSYVGALKRQLCQKGRGDRELVVFPGDRVDLHDGAPPVVVMCAVVSGVGRNGCDKAYIAVKRSDEEMIRWVPVCLRGAQPSMCCSSPSSV